MFFLGVLMQRLSIRTTFAPPGAARKAAQENCCLDRAWTDGVRAGSTDANGTDPERAPVTPVGRANPTGGETGHDRETGGLDEKARRSAWGKNTNKFMAL